MNLYNILNLFQTVDIICVVLQLKRQANCKRNALQLI